MFSSADLDEEQSQKINGLQKLMRAMRSGTLLEPETLKDLFGPLVRKDDPDRG